MDNKQNDWVLATLANPDFNFTDFSAVGITADNTSLYDRQKYLNSNLIQNTPEFQTEGHFDEAKFNTFYDNALKDYNALSEHTDQQNVSQAMFSYNNIWVDKEKRKKQVDFNVVKINNPDRRNFGIERIGYISNPTRTPEEIAQNKKVWDSASHSWKESPNDAWLFRNWLDPIALAVYETDVDAEGNPTTDESKIAHRKGEYKINPDTGTYYYETLNGKTPHDRQILTMFDVTTKDGSTANKYDFFDSDGVDKSIIGTVAKNVMRIAPAFVKYVKGPYIALNVALEAAKFLPTIYKSTFGLVSEDNSIPNDIEAFAMQFDNNKSSLEGQQSFFSSESIVNMIGDITNQLIQQRWLFTKAPKAFKKYGITGTDAKPSQLQLAANEKANQWASDLIQKGIAGETMITADEAVAASLAKASVWQENYIKEYQEIGKYISRLYMTGTSSYQAYEDAKAEGATDTEAAALFWGYFAGMYGIMSTDIGEHVLPELRMQKREIRDILLKANEQGLKKGVAKAATTSTAEEVSKFKGIFQKAGKKAQEMWQKASSPTIAGGSSIMANMLAEGVEEVSEEALYDVSRVTFNLINSFRGGKTQLSVFDNALERYGSSFFGGFIGGGIFEGVNVKDHINSNINRPYDPTNKEANESLIYMIRNGQKKQVLESLEYLRKHGMLGDTNLSADIDRIEGDQVVYKPGSQTDNQNEFAYKLMKNYINNIDTVLSEENMQLSDDNLISGDGVTQNDVIKYLRSSYLISSSPSVGKMLQDYNSMGDRFIALHSELNELNLMDDQKKRADVHWQEKVDRVQKDLEELRKKREEYLSDENQKYYTGLMMFSGNSEIANAFTHVTFRSFAEAKFKKAFEDLTEYEKEYARQSYESYLALEANEKITQAYEVFMNLNKRFGISLEAIGNNAEAYAEARRKVLESVVEFDEIDPETGEIALDDNGQPKKQKLNLAGIIVKMFGDYNQTDEQVQQRARELTKYANPFSELRRFVLQGAGKISQHSHVNDPAVTAAFEYGNPNIDIQRGAGNNPYYDQAIKIMDTFIQNLQYLIGDGGRVDEEVANSIRDIKNELIKIEGNLLMQDVIMGDDFIQNSDASFALFNNFFTGLTLDNLNDKYQDLRQHYNEILAEAQQDDPASVADIQALLQEFDDRISSFTQVNANLIQKNATINSLLAQQVDNPIFKVLNELAITTTGNPRSVIALLREIEQQFILKTKDGDISKFILDGTITKDDIKNAETLITQVQAMIRAAQVDKLYKENPFSFNASMNAIGGDDKLGEIDHITASLLISDLEAFKRKLNFVKSLHDINDKASLKEHTEVGVNLNYLAYDIIGNPDSELYKTVSINGTGERVIKDKVVNGQAFLEKGSQLDKAITEAETLRRYAEDPKRPTNIPLEDQIAIAKEKLNIENALYDRVQELINSGNTAEERERIKEELISVLFSKYISNANNIGINNQPIKKDSTTMGDSVELSYLTSIIAYKSGDFLTKYHALLEKKNSNLAPLPAQTLSVQICYSMTQNKDLFNSVLKALNVEDYGRTPMDSFVMVAGIPGAGKTSAVSKMVHDMVKSDNPKVRTMTIGPTNTQVQNLVRSLNPSTKRNNAFTKDELLEFLGTNEEAINASDAMEFTDFDDGRTYYRLKQEIIDGLDTSVKSDIIFIDESTIFTNAELQLIKGYANRVGAVVILTGDLQQSARRMFWNHNDKTLYNSITTCVPFCAPPLGVSMRASNTNKRDNTNATSELAQNFSMQSIRDHNFSGSTEVLDYIRDLLSKAKIKGSIDPTGAIKGDLLYDKPDLTTEEGRKAFKKQVQQMIDTLAEGEKIGCIYEDESSEIYKFLTENFSSDKIEMINKLEFYSEAKAQGSEHQYFIIDVNWDGKYQNLLSNTNLTPEIINDILSFIQSLHTTISRSKQGSVIIDNGLTNLLGLDVFATIDHNQVNEVRPSDEMLESYRDEQTAIFEAILSDYTPTDPTAAGAAIEGATEGDGEGEEGDEEGEEGQGEEDDDNDDGDEENDGEGEQDVDLVPVNEIKVPFRNNVVVVLKLKKDQIDYVLENGYFIKSDPVVVTNKTTLKTAVQNIRKDLIAGVAVIPAGTELATKIQNGDKDISIPAEYIYPKFTKDVVKKSKEKSKTPSAKNKNTKFDVGDIITIKKEKGKNGRKGSSIQYKIVDISSKKVFNKKTKRWSSKQVYKLQQANKPTNVKEWTTDFVDSNYKKVRSTAASKTAKEQVSTLEKLMAREIKPATTGDTTPVSATELQNILNYADNQVMGVKLYSGLCFRSGIGFNVNPNTDTFTLTQLGPLGRDEENPSDLSGLIVPFLSIVDNSGNPLQYDHATMVAATSGNDLVILQKGTSNVIGKVNNPTLPIKLLSELEATQAKLRSLLMFNNGDLKELHKDIYGEVYNLYARNSAFLQTTKDLTKIPLLQRLYQLSKNAGPGQFTFKLKIFNKDHFEPAVDKVLRMGNSAVPNSKLLVYSIEGCMEITMGVFPNPTTVETYISNLEKIHKSMKGRDKNKSRLSKAITQLQNTLTVVKAIASNSNSLQKTTYWDLGEFNLADHRVTNTKRSPIQFALGNGETQMDFARFKEDPDIICSDPFLFTDAYKNAGLVDPSTAGKAVVFYTTDLNLYYGFENGKLTVANSKKNDSFKKITKSNSNELYSLWATVREQAIASGNMDDLNTLGDKITMVVLSPKGVSLEEFVTQAIKLKEAMRNGVKYITPAGNINTYTRIIEFLINTNIEVKKFLAKINKDSGKSSYSYGTLFSVNGTNAVINFNTIDEVKQFHDDLTQMLSGIFTTIDSNINLADYGIGKSTSTKKLESALGKLLVEVIGDPELIEEFINSGRVNYSAKGTGNTIKTTFSGSHWYEVFSSIVSYFTNNVNVDNTEIAENRKDFLSKLEALRQVDAIDKENPLKFGIFYNPRFKPNPNFNPSKKEMAYPATDLEDHFYVSVVPQTPDFVLPLTILSKVNGTASSDNVGGTTPPTSVARAVGSSAPTPTSEAEKVLALLVKSVDKFKQETIAKLVNDPRRKTPLDPALATLLEQTINDVIDSKVEDIIADLKINGDSSTYAVKEVMIEAANKAISYIYSDVITEFNNRIPELNISSILVLNFYPDNSVGISTLEEELHSRKNYKKTDFNNPLTETQLIKDSKDYILYYKENGIAYRVKVTMYRGSANDIRRKVIPASEFPGAPTVQPEQEFDSLELIPKIIESINSVEPQREGGIPEEMLNIFNGIKQSLIEAVTDSITSDPEILNAAVQKWQLGMSMLENLKNMYQVTSNLDAVIAEHMKELNSQQTSEDICVDAQNLVILLNKII